MTGPVTTEALADQIEAKMKAMSLLGGDALRAATHDLGSLAYIHSTQIVRALRSEAAHQQVTAERDEARADLKAAEDSNDALNEKLSALAPHGSCACSYDKPGDVCMHHSPALATATSELARLRAEGEAKDRALKPFADAADAYPVSDVARREARRQEEVIWSYGCEDKGNRREITVADIRAARAATAREG